MIFFQKKKKKGMAFLFWEVIIFLKMIPFYKDTKMNKYKQKTGQQHKSAVIEFCKGMSECNYIFFFPKAQLFRVGNYQYRARVDNAFPSSIGEPIACEEM